MLKYTYQIKFSRSMYNRGNNIANFGIIVKPFLSEKVKSKEVIILVNNGNIESNVKEVAKALNNFFLTCCKKS